MLSTSTHVYSEIHIHLNWHCKNDVPLLNGRTRLEALSHIENYCHKTKGVKFLGIGGTSDHIHLVIQMEPFICLADWVGKVKGASSHDLNLRLGKGAVAWQRGYGAVSFGRRDLEAVLRYVDKQEEHHRRGTTNATMELFGERVETEMKKESKAGREAALKRAKRE